VAAARADAEPLNRHCSSLAAREFDPNDVVSPSHNTHPIWERDGGGKMLAPVMFC
jgi:hypothetical protein